MECALRPVEGCAFRWPVPRLALDWFLLRGSGFLPVSEPFREAVSEPDSTLGATLFAFLLLPLEEGRGPPPAEVTPFELEVEGCLLEPRALPEGDGFFSSFLAAGCAVISSVISFVTYLNEKANYKILKSSCVLSLGVDNVWKV